MQKIPNVILAIKSSNILTEQHTLNKKGLFWECTDGSTLGHQQINSTTLMDQQSKNPRLLYEETKRTW